MHNIPSDLTASELRLLIAWLKGYYEISDELLLIHFKNAFPHKAE